MLNAVTRKIPRPVVRLYAALAVAVVAGTMLVLGLAVAATRDLQGVAIVAAAIVWIPQTLITAARYRRH